MSKPRVRYLPRVGDTDRVTVTFSTPDGREYRPRLLMVSASLNDGRRGYEMNYLIARELKRFDREVTA